MHSARTFRLFVSSTFSDFIAEREALQLVVFPELERYCAMKGSHFQAVDLRWGITEEAQREHDTMRICLEEVRRCQQLSPRPNFAVLLGDRYGWEPVPARIPQEHLILLIQAASQVDRKLIKSSYRLDENAVPPVYCVKDRALDLTGAFRHEAKLLQALRKAARSFRGGARLPYFASATHQEIALGALSRTDSTGRALNPEQHVHVYVRHIERMPHDESAKDFIDWDASTSQVVSGARQRLHGLETQLRKQLGDQVHDLHTTWSRHGRNGAVDKAYLKRFCDEFLNHQKALIDAELAILERTDERQLREQAHQHFGAERARVFAGRKALMERISHYTETALPDRDLRLAKKGAPVPPLILLGGGGSGKSSILARAAQEAIQKSKRSCAIVLQRYIGGVPGTESLMATLSALTADIASIYGQPEPPTPENTKALAEGFQTALRYATASRPMVLFLDALDQLDKTDGAWMLEWLPKELPEHVRVVTSVRTDTNVEQSARRRYPKSLIEVPAMNLVEGRAMLSAWLADKRAAWLNGGIARSTGRLLTPQQEQAVLVAFKASGNGSALWLKLAYEEAASWASWDAPRQLPNTIFGLIEDLIDRRLIKHENHPKAFTERALAYLAAGRFGLSERELCRALGTDKAVRTEFQANEKTQKRWEDDKKLPPILWSRLFFALQPYLGSAQVDGSLLMRWFHREFEQLIKARYLASDEDRMAIHGALADTFLELERELRPEETNDDALFRSTDASGKQVSAALRRVMEQPWQLAMADRQQDLMALLNDFGFCMGKCATNQSRDLYLDLVAIDIKVIGDEDSQALKRFMRTRLHVLQRADRQWPAHRILLQLATDYGQDNPVTRAAHQWIAGGRADWARMEKIVFLPESPRTGVTWIASEHAHNHCSLLRTSSGVRCDDGHLWSWDIGHLCHWDTVTGQALHVESLPTDGRLIPIGRLALFMPWVPDKGRSCALYDPTSGERLWERRFTSPLRNAYLVGEDALAVINGVATHLLDLHDGALRCLISHEESKLPRTRWGKMAVLVIAGRWLTCQYAHNAKSDGKTLVSKSFLAVHDLQQRRPVFADDIAGIKRSMDQYQPFLSKENPLGLLLVGSQLLLWTGQWRALNLEAPKLGLWDLEVNLRAKVPQAERDIKHRDNWDNFLPVAWNEDFLVFSFAHLLVAWHIQSGRIIHLVIDPNLHRQSAAIRWCGNNTLAVVGHSRSRIVDPTQNFMWHLDENCIESLRVPGMERPVLLAARGDILVLSRDYRYDTNQGDYAQPEPLVAHNIHTGISIIFHTMNRVVHNSKIFRHTWLNTGELVVIDGDYLVCLRVDHGVLWEERVETSLGSMLTVVEDWKHKDRFAIVGNRRLIHIDLGHPTPLLQTITHDFEWGAACEFTGDELFLWEDDNAMNEEGNVGRFALWRRIDGSGWSIDQNTFVEAICSEALDFDMMSPYSATRLGGFILIGQSGTVFCFGVNESGHIGLMDTLQGSFDSENMWVRGEMLYVQHAQDETAMYACSFSEGLFGPLTLIPRTNLLRESEEEYVNVRPFRDMALGPLRGSCLFAVGEPVDGWTAWDGRFEGQERHHVRFSGPNGQEARWYGLHNCRILRHRINYSSLPGRNMFEDSRGEGDVRSLVLDGLIYFICEEDGSAWLVKLILPNPKLFEPELSE